MDTRRTLSSSPSTCSTREKCDLPIHVDMTEVQDDQKSQSQFSSCIGSSLPEDDISRLNASVSQRENFKVVVRVRPPVPRELNSCLPYTRVVQCSTANPGTIALCETVEADSGRSDVYGYQQFTFDYVYDMDTQQADLYERSARPAVRSVMEGYNATLLAYGQTGTGKTYTMEGFTSDHQRGIIPRSVEDIFSLIGSHDVAGEVHVLVRASYMQIYNEVIFDLLKPSSAVTANKQLTVRHTPQRGVYVDGLSEWIVDTPSDVYRLIEQGANLRATSTTRMSEMSSRSHAMFTIYVEVIEGDPQQPHSYRCGKLHIVDLAGSEKVRRAGVSGQRLEETKKINKSLHELGNVISALAAKNHGKARHIPFRNSVLTSALRDSLGGNCKTTIIACISPAYDAYAETLSTLLFADRAKGIRNDAVVNEEIDQTVLLRRYEQEMKQLRQQIADLRSGDAKPTSAVEQRMISKLEEEKRKAESLHAAALKALQKATQAHEEEKKVRQTLETQVLQLKEVAREADARKNEVGRHCYPVVPGQAHREQEAMDEVLDHAARYKELLLKQRDIMLNLTSRLNERDEFILQLQEELEAYDEHVQVLEDRLERATSLSQPSTSAPILPAPVVDQNIGCMSKTLAEEYVKNMRVPSVGKEKPRYRSHLNGHTLLSADDMLVEMLMLLGRGIAAPILGEEERTRLQGVLQERAEEIVRRHTSDQLSVVLSKMEHLQAQSSRAEDRCRELESVISMGNLPHADAIEQSRSYFDKELKEIQRLSQEREQELLQKLQSEREVRKQLARDVDRMRFEVGQMLERLQCTPALRGEISRLWQSLQAMEGDVLDFVRTAQPTLWHTLGGLPQVPAEARAGGQDAHREHVDETSRCGDKSICDSDQLALQRELETHRKDRRALQIILEQRILPKVDSISRLAGGEGKGLDDILGESRALQRVLQATLKAMTQ